MTRVFSWLQNVILRQAIIVFLASLTFLGMQAFGYGNAMVAQADTVKTPEGIYYKGVPDSQNNISTDNNLLEKAKNSLKQSTDNNVRQNPNAYRQFSGNTNIGDTVKTPEGTYYKGVPDGNGTNIVEKAKGSLQETAENIKQQMNMD
ncbi:hypothetical protein VB735_19545 [Halotia wernerae UHCC 0503]|nr:hypothetical protein [Halotia wernerae UHCC 0503]